MYRKVRKILFTLPLIRLIISIIRNLEENKRRKLRSQYIPQLKSLISDRATIISSNCITGQIMQDLDMQYNSPTLGLYIWAADYIEFLSHLRYYLTEAKLTFVEHSKYRIGNERRKNWSHWYPIGLLDGKVEIVFLHYHSEQEAADKWNRRAKRVNWEELLIIGTEQNLCTYNDIKKFDRLPYNKKIFFSTKEIQGADSCCFLPEFVNKKQVGDPYKYAHIYYKALIDKLT